MPIQYERDDGRRRIVVTVFGPLQASDMLSAIERKRAEGTWAYGGLTDLRRMTGTLTLGDLRDIMNKAATDPLTEPTHGPVAILATNPDVYAVACKYAVLAGGKMRISVFRELEEAEEWLQAETSL
jgi:hypothetical protein